MGFRPYILVLLTTFLTTGVVLTVPVLESPINGGWSNWVDISLCYAKSCNNSCGIIGKPCDKGKLEQIRFCNNPSPKNGGQWCHGQVLQEVDCYNDIKPGWSEWGNTTCVKTCRSSEDDPIQGTRIRTCTNPPPIHERENCCGDDMLSEAEDEDICKHLPLCSVSTTTTSTTTTTTCIPEVGVFDYGDGNDDSTTKENIANDGYQYNNIKICNAEITV